jgi:hypothetical protein
MLLSQFDVRADLQLLRQLSPSVRSEMAYWQISLAAELIFLLSHTLVSLPALLVQLHLFLLPLGLLDSPCIEK